MTSLRFFRKVFFVLLAMFCLITIVYSHGGRTDSKGGHRDRSDGSYHYHHGYSAHEHYDIDGDGKKDCPYDFDDNTDHDKSIDSNDIILEDDKNSVSFWDVLGAMLTALFPACVISIFCFSILSPIWFWIFGEEKGWLVTLVASVVGFIASYIWLIYRFI